MADNWPILIIGRLSVHLCYTTSILHVHVLDAFVNDHSNCMLRYVVHDSCAPMVRLVGHAFLHCTIALQKNKQTPVTNQ